ncbi:unnamed protein product, partial [Oppiella nova]
AKLLKELGTDRVINYKTENLDEVLTKEFPNGVDVVWETIGGQLITGSKTLSGFYLSDYKHLYAKYLKQLIGDVVNNKLRVVLDLGQNTSEGEFAGIDSVVRGVEVFE